MIHAAPDPRGLATLATQRFRRPSSASDLRSGDWVRDRSVDRLVGRTVWSAVGLPEGRRGARSLTSSLGWAGDSGVASRLLDVPGDDELRTVAGRLERRLRGADVAAPGVADDEVLSGGVEGAAVRADVREGDIVVLHDPLALVMAEAVRGQGAHVVWEVRVAVAGPGTWDFVRRYTAAVDAFLLVRGPRSGRVTVRQVAALLPCP